MSATFRTLVIGASAASRQLLARLIEGSDIVIDDVVMPDQVLASVARRAPDLFVIDADHDADTLTMVCGLLKANPATVLLPLLAIAKSAKQRLAAFEAGIDDFLTHAVRRDGLMVGFGVPIEQEDGSARAIAAARNMLDRFAVLAERWHERFQVETGLGIGINVGEVIAGNVGSAAYMNYTIIGDTVNVASRLGQRARAGEMLFSDAVKHSLDEHGVSIGALSLPALVLRGRSTPIDIFCVPSVSRLDFRPA